MMRVIYPSHPPIRFSYGCDSLAKAPNPLLQTRLAEWQVSVVHIEWAAYSGYLSHQEIILVQANHGNMDAWKQHDISISLENP